MREGHRREGAWSGAERRTSVAKVLNQSALSSELASVAYLCRLLIIHHLRQNFATQSDYPQPSVTFHSPVKPITAFADSSWTG